MEKRKRSTGEKSPLKSPPRKLHVVCPQSTESCPCQGPALPPIKNPNEVSLDSEDEDEESPTESSPAPLDIIQGSAECPSLETGPKEKRVFGPTAPPLNIIDESTHNEESSSDSDDDFGPSLPPSSISEIEPSSHTQFKDNICNDKPTSPCKPQRAEWMLVPPTSSDWTNRIDPTKLKNRKFASGKVAQAPATQSNVSKIWTETYEEKRQRLEDEVLGRSQTPTTSLSIKTAHIRQQEREAEATERLVREYNEKNRNQSLAKERELAQAQGKLKKEEDDDPSKRGFDREKDMALGGRMGIAKKRELMNRAADFSSRFEKGKYL
ncbi:hypothetical protein K3495_g9347 [Podosphaera aphanis]|nr:hypothetical protein K3495_g9347 [Podosphaera aphanis]